MLKDLINSDLFGNEAGEDEDIEKLESYFVYKPDFNDFQSDSKKLQFVRAKKGMGKSALLVQTMSIKNQESSGNLYLYVKGADLIAMQDVKDDSPNDMIYGWQQRICSRINYELGARLRFAFSDEKITLIESAEVSGFRGRNLIGSLIDRMRVKGGGIELGRQHLVQKDSESLLKRVASNEDSTVWLFVDDIDATFVNTEHERIKVSTFFSACRNLVNSVKGLHIRASVRSDVWSILAQYDEALDKCEQYMLDIRWSTLETGTILQNKILSYFQREYPNDQSYKSLTDRKQIYALVFKEPFPWGKRYMEAFRPIHILCAGRPRWAAQLCKLGGKAAQEYGNDYITLKHIVSKLKLYGQSRLDDLYREHRHQCPAIEKIIETFAGGKSGFSTQELLQHITEKIIKKSGMPVIDGGLAAGGSLSIAHFLFRMGFICARDENAQESLGFVKFEDRPNLLSSIANLDDGLPWEIHPSYRAVLRISGRNA